MPRREVRRALAALAVAGCALGCGHGAAGRGAESAEGAQGVSMTAATSDEPVDSTDDGFSLGPFRAVVRGKVLSSFERLSEGDASRALGLMAPDVTYTFEGSHALGGTRTSRAAVERWFARLLRLLPGKFTIRSVEVVGWPWRATVYTVFEDVVHPAFGEPYRNHGVQVTDLEWGTAVRIHTYVDTAKVERALRTLAEHGVAEAEAPPIVD
jgi:ketosteroid isomerase-like protein